MRSVSYEACLTKNVNDALKNGFWHSTGQDRFCCFYDANPAKARDLFDVSAGIARPLVGNVMFGSRSLWGMTESQRARFVLESVSVLAPGERERIENRTLQQVLCDEIHLAAQRKRGASGAAAAYLADWGLAEHKKTRFGDLPEPLKARALCAKLLYKRPEYVLVNGVGAGWLAPGSGFPGALREHVSARAPQTRCVFYSNGPVNAPQTKNVAISDPKNFDPADKTYTLVQPSRARGRRWLLAAAKGFCAQFGVFAPREFKGMSACFAAFFACFAALALFWAIDFDGSLGTAFNANAIAKVASLLAFLAVHGLVFYRIKRNYGSILRAIDFYVTKGCNRVFLIHFYPAADLLASGIYLVCALAVAIPLKLLAAASVNLVDMIWPIIIYLAIHAIGFALHYLAAFRHYRIASLKHFFHA